ncbi:hypothetical protein [Candidatus Phytoplasma solani]|uniref:hypothetical protein n=1 Tax=Candidatus Phytoplasma solani TaxID=69896 RepID=UPI00358E958D
MVFGIRVIVFLNTIRNIDVFNILNGDIKNNTPYIRFVTKNLEVEFDWLTLIACEFQEFMSLTAAATYYTVMAQEHTALVQYCTAFAQRNTENAQYFPSRAQEHTAEAQQYTAWAQQDTVMAQEYTADAQQTIQQLQSNNQPKKITINLTEKTITDYSKPNSTKQVPCFELSYDLDELVNFINKLDLSNNPHLQKVRQFVNDFTGKGDKNKKNRPSNEGLFSYPNQTNDLM